MNQTSDCQNHPRTKNMNPTTTTQKEAIFQELKRESSLKGISIELFMLHHGRDVHPMWVKLYTETLSNTGLGF